MAEIENLITLLDEKGRWIEKRKPKKGEYVSTEWIETSTFIENVRKLADYLELAR